MGPIQYCFGSPRETQLSVDGLPAWHYEDRPCVVLFSALMLACPAQQPLPHPNLLPAAPQHSHLCIEPGQARFPYLCSEFCPRAADISFPASSLWVRASLFSPKGSTNFHPQNSIQDIWPIPFTLSLSPFEGSEHHLTQRGDRRGAQAAGGHGYPPISTARRGGHLGPGWTYLQGTDGNKAAGPPEQRQ